MYCCENGSTGRRGKRLLSYFFRQAGSEKVQIEEVMQEIINVYIDKMKEFEVAVKALLERG